jgi:hypothetical protein
MESKPADKETQEQSYGSRSLEDLVLLRERRKIQRGFESGTRSETWSSPNNYHGR